MPLLFLLKQWLVDLKILRLEWLYARNLKRLEKSNLDEDARRQQALMFKHAYEREYQRITNA